MSTPTYSIGAVERDTGLSKDVLRMWERRYGFPVPTRDAHGERAYPADQVERLSLIKRLMDQGHRPGKLMALAPEALGQLTPRHASHRPAHPEPPARADLESLLALVKQHDGNGYLHALQQMAARQGLGQFVQDTVAPLTRQVGLAWEEGRFEVFEEHLFTEMTKRMLRQAIATLPAGSGAPRVLLTSLPGEEHILGLLMLEALLALEGAHCVPLGTEMPLTEISRAAAAHRADIVALSFSAAFPQRQIPPLLEQLRQSLPPGTALWIGGSGISRLPPMTGVLPLTDLKQGVAALNQWRGEKASAD